MSRSVATSKRHSVRPTAGRSTRSRSRVASAVPCAGRRRINHDGRRRALTTPPQLHCSRPPFVDLQVGGRGGVHEQLQNGGHAHRLRPSRLRALRLRPMLHRVGGGAARGLAAGATSRSCCRARGRSSAPLRALAVAHVIEPLFILRRRGLCRLIATAPLRLRARALARAPPHAQCRSRLCEHRRGARLSASPRASSRRKTLVHVHEIPDGAKLAVFRRLLPGPARR